MNKNNSYIPQIGDIVLVWGKDWTSKLVQYLIKKVFGSINPPSHCQMTVNAVEDISAEPQGVVYVNRSETFEKAKRIVVMRYKGATQGMKVQLLKEQKKYIGKGYDYFLFVVWVLQIYLAFLPFISYTATRWYKWLKKKEEHSWGCSELTAALASIVFKIYMGADEYMYQSPHIQYGLAKACPCIWEIVYEMEED